MSRRDPQTETPIVEETGTWDVSTAVLTGAAAAAIGAAVATALEAVIALTVVVGVVLGALVGLLSGYRPLHEDDAERVDRFTDQGQAAK